MQRLLKKVFRLGKSNVAVQSFFENDGSSSGAMTALAIKLTVYVFYNLFKDMFCF